MQNGTVTPHRTSPPTRYFFPAMERSCAQVPRFPELFATPGVGSSVDAWSRVPRYVRCTNRHGNSGTWSERRTTHPRLCQERPDQCQKLCPTRVQQDRVVLGERLTYPKVLDRPNPLKSNHRTQHVPRTFNSDRRRHVLTMSTITQGIPNMAFSSHENVFAAMEMPSLATTLSDGRGWMFSFLSLSCKSQCQHFKKTMYLGSSLILDQQ